MLKYNNNNENIKKVEYVDDNNDHVDVKSIKLNNYVIWSKPITTNLINTGYANFSLRRTKGTYSEISSLSQETFSSNSVSPETVTNLVYWGDSLRFSGTAENTYTEGADTWYYVKNLSAKLKLDNTEVTDLGLYFANSSVNVGGTTRNLESYKGNYNTLEYKLGFNKYISTVSTYHNRKDITSTYWSDPVTIYLPKVNDCYLFIKVFVKNSEGQSWYLVGKISRATVKEICTYAGDGYSMSFYTEEYNTSDGHSHYFHYLYNSTPYVSVPLKVNFSTYNDSGSSRITAKMWMKTNSPSYAFTTTQLIHTDGATLVG